ncbi:hypothetical protein ACWDUN_04015 [Mycobacterium sp. NPDC003323]
MSDETQMNADATGDEPSIQPVEINLKPTFAKGGGESSVRAELPRDDLEMR